MGLAKLAVQKDVVNATDRAKDVDRFWAETIRFNVYVSINYKFEILFNRLLRLYNHAYIVFFSE